MDIDRLLALVSAHRAASPSITCRILYVEMREQYAEVGRELLYREIGATELQVYLQFLCFSVADALHVREYRSTTTPTSHAKS